VRILVSNDDGVHHPGLHALVRALLPLGEVIVSAPDRDRSGVGAALTLHDPVRARQVAFPVEGVRAFAVEGTPGDAVIMGLRRLAGSPVDAVISGINPGNNVSEDLLVSGTVGGALQAYLNGMPAMAVSTAVAEDSALPAVQRVVRGVAAALPEQARGGRMLVNMNFPSLASGRVQGAVRTSAAARKVEDQVEPGTAPGREHFWILRRAASQADAGPVAGTDVRALRDGYISITGLSWDLSAVPAWNTHDGAGPAVDALVEIARAALRPSE
jgi:5'-nucleotidase